MSKHLMYISIVLAGDCIFERYYSGGSVPVREEALQGA
jgi:hypothetical protein